MALFMPTRRRKSLLRSKNWKQSDDDECRSLVAGTDDRDEVQSGSLIGWMRAPGVSSIWVMLAMCSLW
jgi:hypothetical protein